MDIGELIPFFAPLGKILGQWALAHPAIFGGVISFALLGVVFQHAVRLRYPEYATRPEWARWVVFFAEAVTATFRKPPTGTGSGA
jgi:hypothetical protein